MKNQENRRYRVVATYRGEHVAFTVEATTGSKAVAEARRQAKAKGMQFIMVDWVKPVERTVVKSGTGYGPPLAALGGTYNPLETGFMYAGEAPGTEETTLCLEEINNRIRDVWERMVVFVPRPDEPPLKAYGLDGRVFLDDGASGRQELLERTPKELAMVLYDWATYVGYCSEDFDDFVDQCWQ